MVERGEDLSLKSKATGEFPIGEAATHDLERDLLPKLSALACGQEDRAHPAAPYLAYDAVGPNDPEFFVSSAPSTNANVNYRSLTWNGGSPSLSNAASISTPAYAQPVNAPASGSAAINLTDGRLLTAVVRGGSLWTTRHVGLNGSGGSASADRTGCEWFQLGISGTTLGVTQTGRVFDSGNNPLFYYFPSIVVNGQGHAVMGFSGSNASQFISAYFTGRFSGDPAGTFSTVTQGGMTTFTAISPTSAGTPPSGYTLCPTCAAYAITTTATFTPPVNVCLAVPPSLDTQTFLSLALLHGENGVLVDRTTGRFTAPDGRRTVCGSVSSLSPFALAQGPAATPTPIPTPTPTPSPCSETITYTVNEVTATLGGDTFEFFGSQNESITLTSDITANGIFEGGLFLRPNQATTPTGEYSANLSFNVTFDGSVTTTLSRVVKYTVTPTQRLVSFETGDAKTVDLGAKGKLDVTIAPRLVTSISNNSTALLFVPARTDEATFRLHDACATPNTVQFSAATYDADEGAASLSASGIGSGVMSEEMAAQAASTGIAVVQVTRAGDLSLPAEVEYATQSGTALDRTDFTAAYGTLRFAAGENSKSLVILITDDAYQEGQESFFVTLSNPVGVALSTPSTATVRINSDDASTGGSPVEDTSFDADRFVRYHYADFLNRLPDAAGLAFWKGQFDECGQRPAAERPSCREVKRVSVSAAFFLSIEFQETGYLVYRLHQAAFGTGERLQLSRFLNDVQEIRQGIIVGQGNREQQLAANKQLFAERFVVRAEFLTRYPLTMSAQQFVDALNANTGGSLSQAERDAVVSQLAAAGNTTQARAQALRSIADDADFRAREMNRAFVLMQYFGYLRRNPPDAPDLGQDYQGYNFWLSKLNQFNGSFIDAEMVRAFIVSTEYKQRFGQ